jgi:conjugal transfer pilus assembly protein TraE
LNIKRYLEQQKNLLTENKLLKLALLVLLVGLIANAFTMLIIVRRARTVIVPPVVNTKFEITGNSLSDDYLRIMTRYIVALAFNYNPVSARRNFEELLALYDPTVYDEKKREFYGLAETVETSKMTSIFLIQKMAIDDKARQIEIQGQRKQLANEQKIKEGAETFTIEYSNSNGRFAILRIAQKLQQGE